MTPTELIEASGAVYDADRMVQHLVKEMRNSHGYLII